MKGVTWGGLSDNPLTGQNAEAQTHNTSTLLFFLCGADPVRVHSAEMLRGSSTEIKIVTYTKIK